MKITGTLHKKLFTYVVCILCGGYFFSCGLDTVVNMEEPTVTYNVSYYSTDDYTKWYVDFLANDNTSSYLDDFAYQGTDVYYKIYNNVSVLSSHKAAISSVNTKSDYSAAATRMIETYGYQSLRTSSSRLDWDVFVEDNGKERVQFRLTSYKNASPDYSALYHTSACIAKNGTYIAENGNFSYDGAWKNEAGVTVDYTSIDFVTPYRYNGSWSFDFFDADDNDSSHTHDREPVNGDADYEYSSSAGTDTYYVQLYAVSQGHGTTYSPSYSLVLDLGTIPISRE